MGKRKTIIMSLFGGVLLVGLLAWAFILQSNGQKETVTDREIVQMDGQEAEVVSNAAVVSGQAAEAETEEKESAKKESEVKPAKESKTEKKSEKVEKTKKTSSSDKKSTTKKSASKKKTSKTQTNSKEKNNTEEQTSSSKTKTVKVDGLTVSSAEAACGVSGKVVTISKAGTYQLSGTLSGGQVVVQTDKKSKVTLVCKGVTLSNEKISPIYVKSADSVTIELVAGTKNTVTDGKTYALPAGAVEPDAAIYSEEDLNIKGSGSLVVNAKHLDGIASKNDIRIEQGNITVNAVDDGIRGKDGIQISGGSLKVISLSHGLKTTDAAKGKLTISGGTVHIDAVGDGLHTTNQISVTGGSTYIDAKNEGIDTDSSFVMSGGNVTIDGPKSDNHASFICGKGATVNGGTFLAIGSSAMAKSLNTSSTQKFIFYKYAKQQVNETTVKLLKADNQSLFKHTTTRKFQSIIFSSPALKKGSTYSLYSNALKIVDYTVD